MRNHEHGGPRPIEGALIAGHVTAIKIMKSFVVFQSNAYFLHSANFKLTIYNGRVHGWQGKCSGICDICPWLSERNRKINVFALYHEHFSVNFPQGTNGDSIVKKRIRLGIFVIFMSNTCYNNATGRLCAISCYTELCYSGCLP